MGINRGIYIKRNGYAIYLLATYQVKTKFPCKSTKKSHKNLPSSVTFSILFIDCLSEAKLKI
ncbi:60S ribosomal protein L44 [Zea mays]|uniref:60S ribosomal protein L44 n=1 Tax=Zea mays TaxID=4577 RepID=A0A1D6HYQ2_MAIZE|nr:60S ribosomal protein L44 [Zea mays]